MRRFGFGIRLAALPVAFALGAGVAPAQTPMPDETRTPAETKSQEDADVASVFAQLKKIGGTRAEEE